MKWTLLLVAMATSYAQSTNRCADLTRFPDTGRGYRDHEGRDGGCGTSYGRTGWSGSDAASALPRG